MHRLENIITFDPLDVSVHKFAKKNGITIFSFDDVLAAGDGS